MGGFFLIIIAEIRLPTGFFSLATSCSATRRWYYFIPADGNPEKAGSPDRKQSS